MIPRSGYWLDESRRGLAKVSKDDRIYVVRAKFVRHTDGLFHGKTTYHTRRSRALDVIEDYFNDSWDSLVYLALETYRGNDGRMVSEDIIYGKGGPYDVE